MKINTKKTQKGLNFGHTIGHAIETHFMSSDKKQLHGEAIAIGIIIECICLKKSVVLTLKKVDKIKIISNNISRLNLILVL